MTNGKSINFDFTTITDENDTTNKTTAREAYTANTNEGALIHEVLESKTFAPIEEKRGMSRSAIMASFGF